jgi:Lysozyme like domain
LTDRKILSGVLITAFSLSMILGTMPLASAKNNLQSIDGVNKTAIAAAERAAFLLSMPSKTKILDKYENATSLTDSQLVELLKAVGFKGQGLKMAWAVAKAESNGRPFAFNGNAKTGDSSYGIFQINMLGTLGPDRRDKFDLDLNAELFSPVKNAEIVFHMTQGGEDWSSWSSYKKGAVAKWLHKFPNQ